MAKPNGKTALITRTHRRRRPRGGVGAGRTRLAGPGHGRDRGRGERVAAEIEDAGGAADFLTADLSSIAEVRRLAGAVQQATPRLDLLINNAGIGSGGPQGRATSADGYELRFALVNYLAGFLLTHLLLPLVTTSAPARIVNVSSSGQQAIELSAT